MAQTIGVDVTAEQHHRFKIATARLGVKIVDVVRPLVLRELARMERELDMKDAESAKRAAKV